ncbi:hypothetical protein HDU79_005414 [Rhizoclosmatium sp. JEL0117]|nr:hypothetical protein HDU79_005414 [Rhizoclosmatium sp. JEL0117]
MADVPGNLRDISKEDHTLIHPVPPFELSETPYNLINSVFDEAASKNLFMQYDMRHSFTDSSAVTDQVLRFREKKSLAFWYTADEPDGTSIDWRLVQNASDIIKHLDPYHPTTLVLNCNTHGVQTYSRSVDIVMTDVYPISNNLTFSSRWNTPCTHTFGCCGCDACVHNGPRDVFDRLKMYESLKLGKSVWMVVQGFGGSEYWERVPIPAEVRAMVYAGVVGGASGVLYWLRIVYELVDVIAEVGREVKVLSPVLTGYVWYGDAILEGDGWVVGSVWADVKLGVSGNIEVKDSVSRKEWAVDYDVGWKHIVAVVVNLSTSDTIAFEDGKVCSKELKGIDGIAYDVFPSHRGLTKQGTEEDKEDVNQVIVKDGCFHIHHMKPLEVIILEIKA